MPLETPVNYISDLVPTNPDSADPKSEGDDHIRNLKTVLRTSFAGFTGAVCVTGTDGGGANIYTLTPATALLAYGAKMAAVFSPTISNTGATTLEISGLGAKALKSISGADLVLGDLVVGSVYVAIYTGAEFRLLAPTKNYIDQLSFSAALPAQPGGPVPKMLISRAGVAAFAGMALPRVTRTANTMLAASDSGQLIDITSGTFTQTFDACASLLQGWFVLLRNSGTGDVTLDPNGAETIDGLTSFVMYPGECRAVFCDGSALTSTVISPFSKSFTASGTFTKPPGYRQFGGIAWSGAQSGGRDNAPGGILPGAYAGGAFPFSLTDAVIGATETVVIGAGGAPVTGIGAGNPGGNTSFGSLFKVLGATTNTGGAIEIASGFAPTKNGGMAIGFDAGANSSSSTDTIWGGAAPSNNATSDSGRSVYGGGAGGGLNVSGIILPGTSKFAGAGGAASSAGNGSDGVAPAGAGGATHTGAASGAGARGELRIWGIA